MLLCQGDGSGFFPGVEEEAQGACGRLKAYDGKWSGRPLLIHPLQTSQFTLRIIYIYVDVFGEFRKGAICIRVEAAGTACERRARWKDEHCKFGERSISL